MSLDGASGIGSHWAQVIRSTACRAIHATGKILFCVSYSTAAYVRMTLRGFVHSGLGCMQFNG